MFPPLGALLAIVTFSWWTLVTLLHTTVACPQLRVAANESKQRLHLGHGMPRRKKNGQSPARVPSGPPEGGRLGHNTGYRQPQGFDDAMANNFPSSTSLSSSDKEKVVTSMQEMFSHLDPEVIYIVLSECDFKGSTEHGSPVV